MTTRTPPTNTPTHAAASATPGYPLGLPQVYGTGYYQGGPVGLGQAVPSDIQWCGDLMPYGGLKRVKVAYVSVKYYNPQFQTVRRVLGGDGGGPRIGRRRPGPVSPHR